MGKKQKAGKVNKRLVGKAKNVGENEAEKKEESSDSSHASRPIRHRHKDDKPAVGADALAPEGSSDAPDNAMASSVCGLVNLGNTCYLNSCLQTLMAAPVCQEYFQTAKHQIGRSPGIGAGLEILFSGTRDAPKQAEQPRKGKKLPASKTLNPHKLYAAICQHAPQFKGRRQQDSHEVLRILVDGLKEECSRSETAQQKGRQKGTSESAVDNSGASFVESVFGGDLSSCLRCDVCGYESAMTEPFLDLSLPIPEAGPPAEPRSRPGSAPEEEQSSVAKRQVVKEAKPPSTAKQKKRLEKKARQSTKDASQKHRNDGDCGDQAESLASSNLTDTPQQPQDCAQKTPESSVDTLMPPGLEPTPIPNLAEPALVAGEPTWALGGAPLNRENSFGSELGEVDSDDHEADIACMPLMSSAIALPAATEQPDMTNEDVDETDRWGGLPVDSGLPMDPPPPSRISKPVKLDAPASGRPGDFTDSIDALYGGPATGDLDRKLRGRLRSPKGFQAKLPNVLETESADTDSSYAAAVVASPHLPVKSTSVSDTPWELCLQTCLDAFFAAEEVCYTCPQSKEHPPAPASAIGPELEPLESPAEMEEGPRDRKKTRRRRVRFSGDNPEVFLIEKSAEQRGMDFRAAMEGDDYFRRHMILENVELTVKATLRRAWAAASDGVQEDDQLKLELRYATSNRMITLPLLPAVDIGRVQDPKNEGDQADLYAKATLLLDFIVDVANGYGLDALQRLEGSDIKLLPDASHPHTWMVRCFDAENGLWEYPDRSAVPSDPPADVTSCPSEDGSLSDGDPGLEASATRACSCGTADMSPAAEDLQTAEDVSSAGDVSFSSRVTDDEVGSLAASQGRSNVSEHSSEERALDERDGALVASIQKHVLDRTDDSEDASRGPSLGGPHGEPASDAGGRGTDDSQGGSDSPQDVGPASSCEEQTLLSKSDVATCRGQDSEGANCMQHQTQGPEGTEHVGRACACHSGPSAESGSAGGSNCGLHDSSASEISTSRLGDAGPSPPSPEGSVDQSEGAEAGSVTDAGDISVATNDGGEDAVAGPRQGAVRSPAPSGVTSTEGKAWRTDRIHRAPTLLVLHLKRFARTPRGGIQKINVHVPFPFDLDVSKYVDPKGNDGQGAHYTLIGIVEHQGQLNGGHYIAYVQRGLQCDLPQAPGGDDVTLDDTVGELAELKVAEGDGMEQEEVTQQEEVVSNREGSPESSQDSSSEDVHASSCAATPVSEDSTWEDLLDDDDRSSFEKGGASSNEGDHGTASASRSSNSGQAVEGGETSASSTRVCSTVEGSESRSGKDGGKGRRSRVNSSGTVTAAVPGQSVRQVQWEKARAKRATQPLCWYRVSDTLVSRVTEDAVASCQAYILLYMRV